MAVRHDDDGRAGRRVVQLVFRRIDDHDLDVRGNVSGKLAARETDSSFGASELQALRLTAGQHRLVAADLDGVGPWSVPSGIAKQLSTGSGKIICFGWSRFGHQIAETGYTGGAVIAL